MTLQDLLGPDRPVVCAICGQPPGTRKMKKLTISRRFHGCGTVPPWARVHSGCDWRESKAKFLQRMERTFPPDTGAHE